MISILFVVLYTAVNTGLVVGMHNCLFEGVDFFVGKTEAECCCADSGIAEDSSCCNDTSVVVKLNDVQVFSEVNKYKLNQPILILPYIITSLSHFLEHLNSFTLNQLSGFRPFNSCFKTPKFLLYHQVVLYA